MSELALGDEGLWAGLAGADFAAGWGPHGADSLRGRASGASPGDRVVAPFPPTILTAREETELEYFS